MKSVISPPEWRVLWKELRGALWEAVDALPDQERNVVSLLFASGLQVNDIAARIGVHRLTVWRYLAQALEHIRQGLEAKGWNGDDVRWILSHKPQNWREG